MRPGEAVSLDMNDIDLDNKTVWIRDIKTGESRYTFISDEAKQVINEWLKVRPKYIKTAKTRNFTDKIDEFKMFPYTYRLMLDMWTQTLKKAGLYKVDPKTKRITLRPHACRKFFSSQLSKTDMGDAFIEMLLGHEDGVKSVYRSSLKRMFTKNIRSSSMR